MDIKHVTNQLKKHPDGVTLNLHGRVVTPRGYAVSLTNNATRRLTRGFVARVLDAARQLNVKAFIGGWRDVETGLYYVDVSVIVKTLAEARTLGRVFGQKAVFSFKTFKEVRL